MVSRIGIVGNILLMCIAPGTVSGTVMELIPNPVRLGQHGTLVMKCYLDQSEKDTPIKTLSKVRIIRNSTREIGRNDAVTIAETWYGNDPTTGAPIVVAELGNVTDVTSRNPTVTGDLNILMGVNTAEVRLAWDARVVVCEDMGDYQCQSIYTNFTSQVGEWTTTSVLQIHTYPANLTMTVQRKHDIPRLAQQNTNQGQTDNDPLEFDVGDIVSMQCTGSVGTDRNGKLSWYRTPDFSDSPFRELQLYNGSSNGIWNEESDPEMDNCQYRRTSIVKYNVSQTDAGGSRFIVFLCRIIYNSTDGTPISLESNRKVFIQIGRRAGTALPTSSTDLSSRSGHTDVTKINEWQTTKKAPIHVEPTSEDRCYMGLKVGGVLVGVIVTIVVIVVVYWKRKARQCPSASAANASDNDMHVYNAIDRPTVKASVYTGLEFGTDGNEIIAAKTQPEPNYENLF